MRHKTREVTIGDLAVGGRNPVIVQSMTTTDTRDFDATIAEIRALEEAQCEMVRVAFLNKKSYDSLVEIKRLTKIPLIVDIHFTAELALLAMEAGADKIRINPGNLGGLGKLDKILEMARNKGVAIRIGVNSGSVEKDLLDKYGYPCPDAIVESAMRWVEYCESKKFENLVLSLKSSNVQTSIQSYQKISKLCDYPLHVGITEAGMGEYAKIKSAVGIGSLLTQGIGDTIRCSIVGDPVEEIKTCYNILKSTGVRVLEPELIACPTCGRIQIDLEKLVHEVEEKMKGIKETIKISVLGCPVNGPGEAREADLGIAGGNGKGWVYRDGEVIRTVKEEELLDALMEEVDIWKQEQVKNG
ncbi:MAG: flavodoxin-dependent (E)-4-hydroxy-3-methylbut-2-enyl-diphosphate synthase [Candidatus Cloacimonetes bacterium]|nr:flavodoxin-dependent (E)-4-hydroxy-3-methylbut-2-enyl-diphosphate synthase [Candidatus Cloacimonadota bacterium]